MSLAYRCETCDSTPDWRLERRGDVVTTWACDPHLPDVLRRLRRDQDEPEGTVVTVRRQNPHA